MTIRDHNPELYLLTTEKQANSVNYFIDPIFPI